MKKFYLFFFLVFVSFVTLFRKYYLVIFKYLINSCVTFDDTDTEAISCRLKSFIFSFSKSIDIYGYLWFSRSFFSFTLLFIQRKQRQGQQIRIGETTVQDPACVINKLCPFLLLAGSLWHTRQCVYGICRYL